MNKKFLTSIFITAFIDMLGVGIIIPVIPAIFYSETSGHFAGLSDPTEIRWAYCLLLAAFPFMQFFGAPILGGLSDRFGRKKILMISTIGAAIGYSIFSLALHIQNLPLLFISRMVPGFFGGSLSVLFSAISDVSSPEDKPKNFGLVGMAFGLGFVFGPFMGAKLADNTLVSWFNVSIPFVFTMCLSLLNFALIVLFFKETSTNFIHSKLTFFKGFQNLKTAFTSVNLRTLFTITFLNTLGFAFYTQFFSVYMFTKFNSTIGQIGNILLWIGLWLVLTQGLIIRIVSKKFSPTQIISISMLILGLGIIAQVFPNSIPQVMFVSMFIAVSQGLNSPNLLTLVSKQALPNQQGEILGINQSMQSLGLVIPPLLVAILGKKISIFPFLFGGSLIVLAWAIFIMFFKKGILRDQ